MSTAQENGKLTAELKTAQLQIEQLTGAATASQATIDAQAAQIAADAATIATMQTTIDTAAATQEAAHAELTGQVSRLGASVVDLTAKNAAMKTKLENPAFKAASAEGEDLEDAGGGGDGGAQGGTLMEQYKAIKDPAARAAFLEQNQAALIKEG